MMVLTARHEAQEQPFRTLVDRSDLYVELLQSDKEIRWTLSARLRR